jgi:hypothetical protein
VGTTIDARRGRVALRTALTDGETQMATFWAGVFQVRQNPRAQGLTDIVLRGRIAGCSASSPTPEAGVSRRRRVRRLWAKDDHGRYRTRGGNSVATTRGTTWLTVERCGRTVTRVFDGAVLVRNRHTGRRVLVEADERYAARRPR